jgi:hypothetical protein
LAGILIAQATGQGACSSVAIVELQGWSISAATGLAFAGGQYVPGAQVGNRQSIETTRPAQLSENVRADRVGGTRAISENSSRPSRISHTSR